MRRRRFITAVAAIAANAIAVAAQESLPIVGILDAGTPGPVLAAFRQGLEDMGFVEGRDVAIEYRLADGRYDQLPAMAADLVRRRVAVIAATGTANTVTAAKQATASIPIVFAYGGDPVAYGLVASLARPDANVTGVTMLSGQVVVKRVELIRELLPAGSMFAFLVNPRAERPDIDTSAIQVAARNVGLRVLVLRAADAGDFEGAFAELVRNRADFLLVNHDPFLASHRARIVALAARHKVPAAYPSRLWTEAGGLVTYASSFTDGYRRAGTYVGRILKGARPADLPVLQPTKFELVINLKTAKALGLAIPPTLLARADEVIE